MRLNRAEFISLSPAVFLYCALAIILIPLEWLLSVLIAAICHEACHCVAVSICGGEIRRIQIGAIGTVMEISGLNYAEECLCALAGPLGSFMLFMLTKWIPLIGLCAAIQGFFNMIPIYPLDGGRALRCILRLWFPNHAEAFFQIIECLIIAVIGAAGCYLSVKYRWNHLPFLITLMLSFRLVSRKRPCKD